MIELSFRRVLLNVHLIGMLVVSGHKILQGSPGISSDISVTTAEVTKLCYGERVKTIGLVGNISDSFFASVSSGDAISSAVMLDIDEREVESGAVSLLSRYKLEVLVVTATSSLQFEEIVVGIKKSRWWNHMAQLLIFDPSGKAQCSEAYDFLWIAWTMNILGAKFVCNRGGDQLLIYRFNPYTESAPTPWKVQRIYKGVNDHPWALLVRKFENNVEICENMDFDPTKDCGGYKIRLAMSAKHKPRKQSKTNRFSEFLLSNEFLSSMSKHMKVTLNISYCPPNETLGFVDEQGKGHGLLANLINGRSDVLYHGTSWRHDTRAVFQGQLAALLTEHVRYPNIDNWQDLINSDYIIYTLYNMSVFFDDPAFKLRHVIEFNNYAEKCTDYVSKNSSIACVGLKEELIAGVIGSKLHMSRNPVLEVPMSLALRNDWPLEERFNRHNRRNSENGFRKYLNERVFTNEYRALELVENEGSGEDCKVLTLEDLDFAFALFAIGLGCAFIAFIIELFIGRVRSARVNNRRRFKGRLRPVRSVW